MRLLLCLLCCTGMSTLAQTIPASFFGMHVAVSSTSFSTPILSPVVVHAQGKPVATNWQYMETARGTYNFASMDAAMVFAKSHGVPIFISHQFIPKWATSDTSTCSAAATSGIYNCTAAPNDLHTSAACQAPLAGTTTTDCMWKEFLTTLVQRYKSTGTQTGCTSGNPQCNGVIQMYEGWNEPPYPTPMATADFVTFETDFVNTVRSNDSQAKVNSPAFIIDPSFPSYATFMASFFSDGGPKTYDAYDFHINAANPEDQIALVNQFKSILSAAGVSNPTIYATEAGRWGECSVSIANAVQQSYIARIEPIYWSLGVQRHYWYAYDTCGTLTNQITTSSLMPSGIAYGNIENWMIGATMGTLSMNGSTNVDNATFSATLTRGPITNILAWNSSGSGSLSVSPNYIGYLDITGVVHPVVSNSVPLTSSPVLIKPLNSLASFDLQLF